MANWQARRQRITFAVDRRLVLGDRGHVRGPQRGLPIAEQLGTHRLYATCRIVEPVHHRGLQHDPDRGYQFWLNVPSSVGAKVNFIALQAGIG